MGVVNMNKNKIELVKEENLRKILNNQANQEKFGYNYQDIEYMSFHNLYDFWISHFINKRD